MKFVSTRGGNSVTGAEAIALGIASNGGLFGPEAFPKISEEEIQSMLEMDYAERTALILSKFFDEFDGEELLNQLKETYSCFEGDPAPLVRIDEGKYILELFHGPTCAFTDLSLGIFPYLLKKSAEVLKIQDKILVLAATSGDVGKAAFEAFKNQANVKLQVFYPEEGVSAMQRLFLTTQEGEGLSAIGVRGNFDDCMSAVNNILSSQEYREKIKAKGYVATTANSVNIARISAQIAYYFSAYCDLVSSEQIAWGEKADFTLPTGGFGNAIAAYYAKEMGLPVGRILCASNKNNAVTDFIRTGAYNMKRNFFRTMSPSMDILLATNLERLIYELGGRDAALTKERMTALQETGKYSITPEELKNLRAQFSAGFTSEDDTVECIYEYFSEYGYPMDTHTGVGMSVADRYLEKRDPLERKNVMIVVSTTNPYKFPQDVLYALSGNDAKDSFKCVKRINLLTAMKVPDAIKNVRYKPVLFKTIVSPKDIGSEVLKFVE